MDSKLYFGQNADECTHGQYGCIEVPTIRLRLRMHDEEGYSMIFDSLTEYSLNYNSNPNETIMQFELAIMRPKDFQVLTSRAYNKYIVEVNGYWRSADTGEDEVIETPVMIFNNCNFSYNLTASGDDPARFRFVLYNKWG